MKLFTKATSNYWQTFRRKRLQRRVIWWVIKLALLVLSLVCKLIDFISGVCSGD